MASKNPIKGYVRCHMPDCEHLASVHAVGEHRILQDGQPPKNKRNTGRLYYNCPSCGFQQGKGQAFQDWIDSHMKPNKSDFDVLPVTEPQTEVKLVQTVEIEPDKPVITTEPKPEPTKLQIVTPYIAAAFALVALIFMLMKSRKQANEQ